MKPEEITAKIRAAMPDAEVTLKDLTGTQDHWDAVIVSAAFDGKSLIERHRLVNRALAEELKGPIHALTLTVKTPTEAGSDKPSH
jgi:stress-induced morphogen